MQRDQIQLVDYVCSHLNLLVSGRQYLRHELVMSELTPVISHRPKVFHSAATFKSLQISNVMLATALEYESHLLGVANQIERTLFEVMRRSKN